MKKKKRKYTVQCKYVFAYFDQICPFMGNKRNMPGKMQILCQSGRCNYIGKFSASSRAPSQIRKIMELLLRGAENKFCLVCVCVVWLIFFIDQGS